MKIRGTAGIMLAMAALVSTTWAGQPTNDQNFAEYHAAYQIQQVQQPDQPPPPRGAFVVIPQYFHSRNSKATGKMRSDKLSIDKATGNGAGITALFSKRMNDFFTFNIMYEYGFMKFSGGAPFPEGLTGTQDERWHSHVVGVLPEFNFDRFGKLQLSLIQGFDRASGDQTLDGVGTRSNDKNGTNVTSLMAWYEKDIDLSDNWKITPYAGWRSLYVVVKDGINWAGGYNDDNMWVHLVSAGLKVGYQCGRLGLNLRAGVNHRTTGDDVPGYGNRAVAPGVVQFSHRANWDRTVGTFGLGASYAISPRAIMAVGYDGFYGSDTTNHLGSVTLILPF